MISEKNAPRLLGALFLIVIITSGIGGPLFNTAVGTAGPGEILTNVAAQIATLRASIVWNMLNSLGITALAALLYTVLRKQDPILALIALGWWLGEALFYAIAQLGAFALIPLSQSFIQAGAPAGSFYQTLAGFLMSGIYKQSYTLHMFFYCSGGILWYFLFFQSRAIPRLLALFGVAVAAVGWVGVMFEFTGAVVPIFVFIPIGLFELLISLWLMFKGIPNFEKRPLPSMA
jgi:hypothetical protein